VRAKGPAFQEYFCASGDGFGVFAKDGAGAFAFVTVDFTDAETICWEEAGQFFTDSGDGCIFDASAIELLREEKDRMSREEWGQLKTGALLDGDGNLILDEKTGVNATVCRSGDWAIRCFIGRDSVDEITCLVVDGRTRDVQENSFIAFIKSKVACLRQRSA
jgi:hypothetical protein